MSSNQQSPIRSLLLRLASLKITVACLLLFMVITVLGTLYQVDHGISEAREIFFSSWLVMIGNVFPFPGGQLLLWVFGINLLSSCFVRFGVKWNKTGIWLTHLGLLVLCISSFYTYQFSVEATLQIAEGDTATHAMVDSAWELAIWHEENGNRMITGYPMNQSKQGTAIDVSGQKAKVAIDTYHENCDPQQDFSAPRKYHNASGISDLTPLESGLAKRRDMPGIIITVTAHDDSKVKLLLFGGERFPTSIQLDEAIIYFQLRPRQLKLPAKITLVDVKQDLYHGTQMAKNYESNVTLHLANETRDARIYMNHPLSIDDFTFYQSSYGRGMDGRESTTLSVVKNSGKYFPYVACILTSIGMILHFMTIPLATLIKKQIGSKE